MFDDKRLSFKSQKIVKYSQLSDESFQYYLIYEWNVPAFRFLHLTFSLAKFKALSWIKTSLIYPYLCYDTLNFVLLIYVLIFVFFERDNCYTIFRITKQNWVCSCSNRLKFLSSCILYHIVFFWAENIAIINDIKRCIVRFKLFICRL